MNDHKPYRSAPPHKPVPPQKKGFLASTFNRLFYRVPKNRHDLIELIHNAQKLGLINNETDNMLEGVMKIAELRVRDIMIPRSQIITLKRHQTLSQCLTVIIGSAHSRFPVISEDKDHIDGLLMAKDLLPYINRDAEPFNLDKLLRPAVMVPESKRVDHILKEFRCQHYHLAIVVDEFGSVSGLITIEDILEQIVGDIVDEYDNPSDRTIRQLSDHAFSIHALTTIEDFNSAFGTDYISNEVDTIGGLVMQTFGYLPDRGETVTIDGYHFKVTRADSRHIMQLQVTRPRTKVTNTPR